ncbi:MAG: hypothetical protein LBU94_02000 [Clostridiales bacterium]|jgi:spore coat protein I|nr:hypothetical protein [Clostridiales bacterium]
METFKKLVNGIRRLSDFDILFLKNYDFYYNNILEAEKITMETGYDDNYDKAVCDNMICHNNLKKDNILLTPQDDVYILNFSGARVDYYTQDLADFIYRYIKNQPENRLNVDVIIEAYSEEKPVTDDDIKILYGCLLFPGAFLKASRLYYNKKRSWAPSSVINRMEQVLSCKDIFHEYISNIWV